MKSIRLGGEPGKLVKIYNANLRSKREGKVRAMVGEGLAVKKTDLIAPTPVKS